MPMHTQTSMRSVQKLACNTHCCCSAKMHQKPFHLVDRSVGRSSVHSVQAKHQYFLACLFVFVLVSEFSKHRQAKSTSSMCSHTKCFARHPIPVSSDITFAFLLSSILSFFWCVCTYNVCE